MSSRTRYIDLGAGIMLLWMVCYHVLQKAWWLESVNDPSIDGTINPCVVFPYLNFFMPYFFYKSGMFFQRKPWRELLKKDSKKLLLTYVIWGGIGYMVYVVMCVIGDTLSIRALTYCVIRKAFLTGVPAINGPCWFLLALFIVHIIANMVLPNDASTEHLHTHSHTHTHTHTWRFHVRCAAIIIICYGLAALCYYLNLRLLPRWIAYSASGLGFYTMGYWMNRYEKNTWISWICIAIYVMCCVIGFPMVDMACNKLLYGSYLSWMPVAGCSIVAFNTMCVYIEKAVTNIGQKNNRMFSFFEYVGINAMPIFVSHFLFLEFYVFMVYQKNWFQLPHMLICTTMMLGLVVGILCYKRLKDQRVMNYEYTHECTY